MDGRQTLAKLFYARFAQTVALYTVANELRRCIEFSFRYRIKYFWCRICHVYIVVAITFRSISADFQSNLGEVYIVFLDDICLVLISLFSTGACDV